MDGEKLATKSEKEITLEKSDVAAKKRSKSPEACQSRKISIVKGNWTLASTSEPDEASYDRENADRTEGGDGSQWNNDAMSTEDIDELPLQASGGIVEKKSFISNLVERYGTGAYKPRTTAAIVQEELAELAALSDEGSVSEHFDLCMFGEDSCKKKLTKTRKSAPRKKKTETPAPEAAGDQAHSSTRFPCNNCGKSYASRTYLKKHQIRCVASQMDVDNGNSPGLHNWTT